jgi:multimeric flavodoxin WrbA
MKIYAVNGGPRKGHNTAKLLHAALDGASAAACSESVETEIIHLYDLDYKGCVSCYSCKKIGGKSYGHCAVNDALTPVLEKLSQADGIIFGSPIYFGNITGKLRSFFERLLFAYFVYDMEYSTLAPKRMPTAFVYTMNVHRSEMEQYGYPQNLKPIEIAVGRVFSEPSLLHSCYTYQFDDYSKYMCTRFSEPEKAAHREKQFPLDLAEAGRLGAAMVAGK